MNDALPAQFTVMSTKLDGRLRRQVADRIQIKCPRCPESWDARRTRKDPKIGFVLVLGGSWIASCRACHQLCSGVFPATR